MGKRQRKADRENRVRENAKGVFVHKERPKGFGFPSPPGMTEAEKRSVLKKTKRLLKKYGLTEQGEKSE